jgi:hypothetical protein
MIINLSVVFQISAEGLEHFIQIKSPAQEPGLTNIFFFNLRNLQKASLISSPF